MDDQDLEQLVVQMSADYKSFQNDLQKSNQIFKSACDQIIAQQTQLKSKLLSGVGSISLEKVLGLVGGTAVLDRMIDSSKELADQTLNTSKNLGISAELLQGLGIIARHAGVDQDSLNQSLSFFSSAIGEAELKATPFGNVMNRLGVDLKNGPEAAILSLSDKIGLLPKAQQAAVARMSFGRGGVGNLSWLTEGSKNLQAMVAQFQQMGMVVPTDKLQKIQQLFDAWQDIKTEALTGFMTGFSSFAGEVQSPEFQAGLQTFGQIIGEISGAVVTMAPYFKTLVEGLAIFRAAKGGAMIGGRIGSLAGPEGTAAGILVGGAVGAGAAALGLKHLGDMGKGGAAPPEGTSPPGGKASLGGALDEDQLKRQIAAVANLNKALDQQQQESEQKSQDSYSDIVRATYEALVETTRGTNAYYAALQAQITGTASLDITKVQQQRDAEIAAIKDRQEAQLASLETLKLPTQVAANERVKINTAADAEIANAQSTAAFKTQAINIKMNQQLQQADWRRQQQIQDQIDLTTGLRDGLENVAEAGLHGFKSLKDAAADFLDQIAQTIIKLYVMQPLLNSLFGAPGTSGGGMLGGVIGDISGWLSTAFSAGGYTGPGGRYQPAGVVHAGEFVFDQDAVKRIGIPALTAMQRGYANGGLVGAVSNMGALPTVSPMSGNGGGQDAAYFDLRGAVVTEQLLAQMNEISAKSLLHYDRNYIPGRVAKLIGDPRRRY